MSGHSPGPWTIDRKDGNRHLRDADGISLMCDEQYYPWAPSDDADWRLMAAAPELLAAAKLTVKALNGIGQDVVGWADEYEALTAAIAKAEGS